MSECGAESSKWIGRCPSARSGIYHEEIIVPASSRGSSFKIDKEKKSPNFLIILNLMNSPAKNRVSQLDRITGGGMVGGHSYYWVVSPE